MCLQLFRAVVVLEFNNVLHCPVVSLDLTLSLRMKWLPTNMNNRLFCQKLFQITGDITGAIVR